MVKEIVTIKFDFMAGALIRKQIERELESFLFYNTTNYTIKEDKGLFDSHFFVTCKMECMSQKEGYDRIVLLFKEIGIKQK